MLNSNYLQHCCLHCQCEGSICAEATICISETLQDSAANDEKKVDRAPSASAVHIYLRFVRVNSVVIRLHGVA